MKRDIVDDHWIRKWLKFYIYNWNIPILSSAFTLYILEYDLYLLLEVQKAVVFSRCGDDHPVGDLMVNMITWKSVFKFVLIAFTIIPVFHYIIHYFCVLFF